jgi:hypothetical protein
MKKASRILINNRNGCNFASVEYLYYDKAKVNDCYNNVIRYLDDHGNKFVLASGWLVGDFVSDIGTAIIPHYWIVDSLSRKHYDPTPLASIEKFDYIYDLKIAELGHEYKCLVPLPLLLTADGNFKIRVDADSYIDLNNLELHHLFEISKKLLSN